jgi:ribosomal protein S18 acetylase RimI-like enzyme
MVSNISIEKANREELPEAAHLASRAMIDLPDNNVVFAGKRHQFEAATLIVFKKMPGQVLLAKDNDQIVAVMRLVEWPKCRNMTRLESLTLLPSMLSSLKGTMPRLMKRQAMWAQHDPKEHHWHLDPLAVLPERQGQGIGIQLMKHFCEYVDSHGTASYLETSNMGNVHFYERFGFSVIGEASILGASTWFMWRPKSQGTL